MNSRDFCFWLQGFFELQDSDIMSKKQVLTIKNHLNLVFTHDIDPSMSDDPETQELLNSIHAGLSTNSSMRC